MRRLAIVSICGLMAALLAAYLPVAAFLPSVAPIAFAGGERIPASTVTPLPEFVRTQVVEIEYEANGTAGSSGVFWTELYYRLLVSSMNWALYAPPWNPSGQWFGAHGFEGGLIRGTIPFDTYYTGGEATYEFFTVGVDRGYWREAMPRDHAKARTTLDTRPPNLFVGKPSPDAWTKDGTLTWTSTDTVSGLEAVEAALDDGDVMDFVVEIGAKEASGAEDLGLQVEGDHHVLVRARDRAGNNVTLFVPFHFDPNAPTLTITAPQAGRFLNTGNVEVVWTTGDSASGIASQTLRIDSDAASDVTGKSLYLASGLDERFHTVTIAVFDAAGNFATESVTFGVDVTAPSLALIAPEDASYTREHDLRVLWIGSDSVSGIMRFEVSFAGMTSPPIESGVEFVFADVTQGADTVRVVALDRAGNRAEVSAAVTVDYTPPAVSITSPSAGAEVTGDLSIVFSATDGVSGVEKLQLVYDGSMMDVRGKTSQRIVDPTAGAHIAVVRATDFAGNSAEALVSFEYGAGGPIEPSGLPALEFWLLILLISAIAIGSAYYAVRRRNRSKA